MLRCSWCPLLSCVLVACAVDQCLGAEAPFALSQEDGQVTISWGDQPVAKYVYRDVQTPRPYFKDLKTPTGIQVSRNHPPRRGIDAEDHGLLHPGLWLAFGDVNGQDTWRLKSKVVHEQFVEQPRINEGVATFSVVNRYETSGGAKFLGERSRYTFARRESGWLLIWDSTFTADSGAVVFGDQEEMGLGVRLATPLTVKNGGEITNSNGQKNEKGCWGQAADWCDYGGTIAEKRFGILLMGHTGNFKKSTFHARDYGFVAANPFAEKAFGRGQQPANTTVRSGDSLRLRFGILIYGRNDGSSIDGASEFTQYLKHAE
jgi:hypothetical protein